MGFTRLIRWPVALLLAVFVISGCDLLERETIVGVDGQTMGTTFSVRWVDTNQDRVASIRSSAGKLLSNINRQMSTYIPDSELSIFNRSPAGSLLEVSQPLIEVVDLALEISSETQGAFDPTVGPLVNLWGFGPDGRIENAPESDAIAALQSQVGYQNIETLSNPNRLKKLGQQYLDLSAIAKGYAVDQLALLLEAEGIDRYLVEIGGELRARGVKPDENYWRIAIESPVSEARAIERIIEVKDVGIATSGDYRNFFEEDGVRFSHTIDPTTGRPITHRLASVTVLRPSAAEADALATAILVKGEEQGYQYAVDRQIAAFFIVKDREGSFVEKMTPEFEQFIETEE